MSIEGQMVKELKKCSSTGVPVAIIAIPLFGGQKP